MKRKLIIELLEVLSKNSTCKKLKTSAVIIKNKSVVSLGYNGSPRGTDECETENCLIINNHCVRCVHAEQNAIINAARNGVSLLGSIMYCLHFPCKDCLKQILNAGVSELYYVNDYIDEMNKKLLEEYLEKKLIIVKKLEE
jgi:dCMP deaminase